MYDKIKEAEMLKKLKSIEVKPPIDLWDDIEATLDSKSKRKSFIITSWASAATIALLISVAGFYHWVLDTKNNEISVVQDNSGEIKSITKSIQVENPSKNINTSKSSTREIVFDELAQNQTISKECKDTIEFPDRSKSMNENLHEIKTVQSAIRGHLNSIEKVFLPKSKQVNLSNAVAQNETPKKRGEWYISTSGFPVYSFHTAGAINRSSTLDESGIVSWGGSLNLRHSLSNNFSIEFGLTYSTVGQQESNIFMATSEGSNPELDAASLASNSYGILEVPKANLKLLEADQIYGFSTTAINATNLSRVSIYQKFRYIELPILLSRRINYKNLAFIAKSGLSIAYLVGNRLEMQSQNLKLEGKTKGVDPFAPSAIFALGVSMPFSNHVNLLIEPTFKIGLKPLYSVNNKTYPFSTFIKFGVEIPF